MWLDSDPFLPVVNDSSAAVELATAVVGFGNMGLLGTGIMLQHVGMASGSAEGAAIYWHSLRDLPKFGRFDLAFARRDGV
jgi:hypothetical protein